MEEANATLLGNDVINISKMRMVWKLVTQFTNCQIQYPITMDSRLRAYLKSAVAIPETEAYEISYRLEPKTAVT